MAPRQLLPHAAELLRAVLPCLGHADGGIAAAARQVNAGLLEQVQAQQAQRGRADGLGAAAAGASSGLDSQALLSAVRWGWLQWRVVGTLHHGAHAAPLGFLCVPTVCPALPAWPGPACSQQLEGEAEVSKLEALQWVNVLLSRDARLLREQRQLLLVALTDALGAASGELQPHARRTADCMGCSIAMLHRHQAAGAASCLHTVPLLRHQNVA